MAKIITLANQKGGVAKTTTVNVFGMGLKEKGYKVLLVDLDPQGNLSSSIGAEVYDSNTTYELLMKEITAKDCIQETELIDIIPSNIMLGGVEQEMNQIGKEYRLNEKLSKLKNEYDFILIDTPPMLGILTINALTTSDEVIIPTTAGIFAANGIYQLNNTIENVKKYCNKNLEIAGILLTRFDSRIIISNEIKALTEELSSHMDVRFFDTNIRNSVVIEESQANQKNLLTYRSDSTVAKDYKNFVDEYLLKLGDLDEK